MKEPAVRFARRVLSSCGMFSGVGPDGPLLQQGIQGTWVNGGSTTTFAEKSSKR